MPGGRGTCSSEKLVPFWLVWAGRQGGMGWGELGMPVSSVQTPHTPVQEAFLVFAWMHVAQKEGLHAELTGTGQPGSWG